MPTTLTWIHPNDTFLTQDQQLNNAQIVAYHFANTDWVKESISALCGNMAHESSLNPDMHELGYNDSPDRGYGLVQWTPMTKYTDWATANNLPWDDGDSQLARIDYEVVNNIQWIPRSDFGNMTFAQFRANSGGWTVDYLTEAFMRCYERPNWDAGTSSLPSRQSFANLCMASLDWTGTGGGTSTPYTSRVQSAATQYQYEEKGALGMYVQVQPGDNLSAIANKYGVNLNDIKQVSISEIPNKNLIHVGDILLLPAAGTIPVTPAPKQNVNQNPEYYWVVAGDNLTKIANRYGKTVTAIVQLNGLKDANLIKIGQRLRVK